MRTVLAFFFILLATAARGQPEGSPLLLVASPALQGAYKQTVLIAVPAGEGHVGFILNRPTDARLATLFPGHAPSAKVADAVYLGGPELEQALFAIVRRDPGAGAVKLFGNVFLVANADAVDRVIERTPNEARYFLGFVGWRPGELGKEIEAGYWHVADADAQLFFRPVKGDLWQELVERLGNGHRPQRGPGFVVTAWRSRR
jgi:putative transcriptional regulator